MKKYLSLILALTLAFSLCCCTEEASTENTPDSSAPSSENVVTEIDISQMDTEFTDKDLNGNNNGSAVILSQDIIKITDGKTYCVTGKHKQIIVDSGDSDKPQIILKNAQIESSDGPAIYIKNADKVFLTIPENTESSLSDATQYDNSYDNADGVVFSKADLTLNGGGKLTVKANFKCGIVSKDDLVISETVINIESKGCAVEGKDCVKLNNADITVNSEGDGIKSTNSEDANRGFIYIASGKCNITSTNDALQGSTALIIEDGVFNLKTGGGSAVASSSQNNNWGKWGRFYENPSSSDTESAKALKAVSLIKIQGGDFSIDSSDDAIHSNSDIEISSGNFNISSGDDGVHADDELLINGGDFTITKSYEGLEATVITVNGGEIDLTASDDGFNAAGGNDSSALGGRPGQNPFGSDFDAAININGGYILVNASGDGIDSNGSITVNGGTILVSGPQNGGNGAFDYGISAEISGGTAIIVGTSDMAQSFASSSKQASFIYNSPEYFDAGTPVSISKDNKVFASFTPCKKYNSVIISSPELKVHETYSLNFGGNISNTDKNGYTLNGSLSDADSSVEISLTSVSTSFGNIGHQGGMGRPGHGFGRP